MDAADHVVKEATCTVVIATSDLLRAAQERVSSIGGEILAFNEEAYGRKVTASAVLTGSTPAPAATAAFMKALQRK